MGRLALKQVGPQACTRRKRAGHHENPPAEIEGRTAESELLHNTREDYLAALVILDDFEKLMVET